MTSVDSETESRTDAQRLLDIALGKERVSLAGLAASEFDELIHRTLADLYLAELRGFKPLREFLTLRTNDPGSGDYFIRNHEPHPSAVVVSDGFKEPVDGRTHVLAASQGLRRLEIILARKESDELSYDPDDIQAWGRTGYLYKVSYARLVLRRPRSHNYGDKNLAVLSYSLTKVPHEDRYLATEIKVVHLPVNRFREHFGERYPAEAASMIREIGVACSRTLDELKGRANAFEAKVVAMERLSGAIF